MLNFIKNTYKKYLSISTQFIDKRIDKRYSMFMGAFVIVCTTIAAFFGGLVC